jgi:hypothetical protein
MNENTFEDVGNLCPLSWSGQPHFSVLRSPPWHGGPLWNICVPQTAQWPKEKVQKDKQRSPKHTHKTKDRVIRTPLKTGGEIRCSGRVGSSCSTSGTCRVNLVTNPVTSPECGKDREVFTTSGTYPWSFGTQIFHNGPPCHGGDRKTEKWGWPLTAYPSGTPDFTPGF